MTSKTTTLNPSIEQISSGVDAEMRNKMIAEAAYFRAESRGFSGDCVLKDWLEAECEIDTCLEKNNGKTIQVI
jgi:hypothetical protein